MGFMYDFKIFSYDKREFGDEIVLEYPTCDLNSYCGGDGCPSRYTCT